MFSFCLFFQTLERCKGSVIRTGRFQQPIECVNGRKLHQLTNCIRFCLSRIYAHFSIHFECVLLLDSLILNCMFFFAPDHDYDILFCIAVC